MYNKTKVAFLSGGNDCKRKKARPGSQNGSTFVIVKYPVVLFPLKDKRRKEDSVAGYHFSSGL